MKYKPHKLIVTALRKKDKIKIKPFYCSLQPPLSLTSSSSLFFYLLLVGVCTHWSSQIWLSKTTITNSTSGPSRPITRKSWQTLLSFTLFVCFALYIYYLLQILIWPSCFQGPMIRTEEEEDYTSPQWLMPLLRGSYFVPCSIHVDSNKNECNLFCLDCAGNAFCSYCLVKHKDHRVVQVQYLFSLFLFHKISVCLL